MKSTSDSFAFREEMSPTAVKADPLPLVHRIMRDVDDSFLRDAERWEDPWDFLVKMKGLPGHCQDFFRAAASAWKAAKKTSYDCVAAGTASLHEKVNATPP